MTNNSYITRIDQNDPRVKTAVEAERNLFEQFGLEYKEHHVRLDQPDIRVRVLEVGSGKPVLMVPGGTGDAYYFAPLIAELKDYRFIMVNRPGGGLSDGIDHRQLNVRQLAVDVLTSSMDAFGLDKVPVICNSMGGLWSFWLALDRPERVSHMVQMGCPALALDTSAPFFMRLITVPGLNRLIAPKLQAKDSETALDFLETQGSTREAIDAMPKELGEAAYHFTHLPTYIDAWLTLIPAVVTLKGAKREYKLDSSQLENVRQPVSFIWGEDDPFGSLDVAHQVVDVLPEATLHEVRTGHLPFLDDPKETAHYIAEFMSSLN